MIRIKRQDEVGLCELTSSMNEYNPGMVRAATRSRLHDGAFSCRMPSSQNLRSMEKVVKITEVATLVYYCQNRILLNNFRGLCLKTA